MSSRLCNLYAMSYVQVEGAKGQLHEVDTTHLYHGELAGKFLSVNFMSKSLHLNNLAS